MAHSIPCHTTFDASNVSNLYLKDVMRLHGIPKSVVSKIDTKFKSHFWLTLSRKMEIMLKFSTTYHPQVDGQTEVTNKSLGTLLRVVSRRTLRDGMSCFLMLSLPAIEPQARAPSFLLS